MAEVQTNPVVGARHLGWIRPTLHDGADSHGISPGFDTGSEHDAVADTKPRVGGESFIDRDGSRGRLEREREKKNAKHGWWNLTANSIGRVVVPALLLANVACGERSADHTEDSSRTGNSAASGTAARSDQIDAEIPTLGGGSISLRSFRGKVVLLNIWASWCGPCRDEFPLLAQLTRELPSQDFAIVAVSDDLSEGDARRFLREYEPPFVIAWGRGSLQTRLGYRGLPFTALLDREGRIMKRYIGFGGERQFAIMRADVLRAINETRAP
jgi:thiol-disulfide isomerase/thioredoxin